MLPATNTHAGRPTAVVSPLISLMKDQADKLNEQVLLLWC